MSTGFLTNYIASNYKIKKEVKRDYIGASSIGSECLRQIWYDYTNAPAAPIPLKLQRTFDVGKILEGFIIQILKDCGLEIETAEESPTKHKFIDKEYPFFQGSCDAIFLNPRRLLEIKTAKDASFNLFVKHGLQKWNYKYFCQLQSYMGFSGINEAYVLVFNKDTSDFWDEFIEFDSLVFERLRRKALMIKEAVSMPPRINNSPLWYQCKTCRFKEICHK